MEGNKVNENIGVNSENEITSSSDAATVSESSIEDVSQKISINNTGIYEYFDIIKNEYEIERNKKTSFENRVGIFLALIGTIGIFLFDKVSIKDTIPLLHSPLTFYILLKIVSCFLVYLSMAFTLLYLIKTITVKKHNNFEVKSIDESLLAENRIDALARIIFTYRDIICQHRIINEERAKTFKLSLYGVIIMLIASVTYISI